MKAKSGPAALIIYLLARCASVVWSALPAGWKLRAAQLLEAVRTAFKARSGPVAWLLYAAVRCAFMVLQAFPIDWNLRTARILAGLWRRITPRHHGRAVAHIAASFGKSLTPEEVRRIADRCLESVVMFAIEVISLPRLINRFSWPNHVRLTNFEETLQLILQGRGLIMVTAHYGPFELMAHLLACLGFKMSAVMRPLDNVYLNRFVVETRRRHGLSLLDKKGAMTEAENILKSGALLGFVGDQDAGRKGIFVDFFGRPASTYKSIGLLAMETGCPIVVGYARRLGNRARYEVGVQRVIHPAEWEQQDDPLRWITQTYTSAIEEFVRECPEQYLWIHRRWKSTPRKSGGASR